MKKFLVFLPIFFILLIIPATDANAYCLWREKQIISLPNRPPMTTLCIGGEVQSNATSCEGTAATANSICCCGDGAAPKTVKQIAEDVRNKAKTPKFTIPNLQVEIPGMAKFSEENCNPLATGGYKCEIPWMSEYIIGLYDYGLSIAGILAAIMLMAGGVLWLISAGDASKITQAKELITGSVSGLIILASSYVLLIQINPDLVKFKSIGVDIIEPVNLVFNGSDSDSNNNATVCTPNNQLISIKNLGANVTASDPRLNKDAAEGLKKAIAIASKQTPPVRLIVSSATRSYDSQKKLWDAELAKQGGDIAKTRQYVSNPDNGCKGSTCSGHCASVAIDVCIEGTNSCKLMSSAYAEDSDPDMKKLQDIMMQAGWKRYCGEWWHFQYGLAPKSSCSP